MLSIQLFLQSFGITPSLIMTLHRSVTHRTPASPEHFNISDATSEGPVALPFFAKWIASLTSSIVNCSQGPSFGSKVSMSSLLHMNSSFNSFSQYSLQTSSIFEFSTCTFPLLPLCDRRRVLI